MDKIKRNERLAAMTQILTASPNRIFTLSHFCELFSTAKSTVSEDVAILQQTMNQFRLGKLETVTGAAGGVRYRPIGLKSANREFVEGICERLREPGRRLPGGYLYFSDILSDPALVQGMGTLIASQYYDFHVDFVLTMETKGIPVAMMTANALRVPLIIARHATKVYEGSAVNISYVSGSGNIETMALSRRAVREGQRCLIVDDFMRGGGTARGMIELMKEFSNLRLIRQEKREGKNSAINCYLDNKTCDIVVMLNADNVFKTEDSLENLILPFKDEGVGITGGRPVPTNDPKDKIGFAVNLMWAMHHQLALKTPKIGEIIAFRDIGTRLRTDMQSDEDLIRMELERHGYRCVYTPGCIILNRGPETEEDFKKQRIRVNIGEITMKKRYDYSIPTWSKKNLARAYFKTIHELGFHPLKTYYVFSLESKCRKEAEGGMGSCQQHQKSMIVP